MSEGKVKFYNESKGFGFIETNDGDIFMHVSNINGEAPQEHDLVSYEVEQTDRGPAAVNVEVLFED